VTALPLTAVAGWDVPLLRGAVSTLTAVAERLPSWRGRMEALGRELHGAECWSGPAATAAGAALVQVSTVATAVTAALGESLDEAGRLLASADTAQELAEQALATAATVPVQLDATGRLAGPLPGAAGGDVDTGQVAAALRAEDLATEALRSAGLAAVAAAAAADALAGLGIGGVLAPVAFEDLAALAAAPGPVPPPPPPPVDAHPLEVAAWWAGLSTAARGRTVALHPGRVGRLQGVPAWARDRANRLVLGRVLARPGTPGSAVAEAVADEIARREAAGEEVQLLQFQPAEEFVALALGDVDTADAVAVLVPGVGNDPEGDLDALVDDAGTVADVTVAAVPAASVATVAWFGYRPPGLLGAPLSRAAQEGGPALDRALDGLAAVRAGDPGRVTVVAHSYGTAVVDRAAEAPGDLAADNVVLLGSPGMRNDAAGLEVDRVYEASPLFDPVSWGGWFGTPTWLASSGAVPLPVGEVMLHTEYYDGYFPTAAAIGEVVGREPE
jgi:hypothetical protein